MTRSMEGKSSRVRWSRRDAMRVMCGWAGLLIARRATVAEVVGGIGANPRHRAVRLPARPAEIAIDLAATAVIVVDMQNDFCSKGGLLDRSGADVTMIRRTVTPIVRVIAACRQTGIPIIYLKMAFRPDLSDVGRVDSPNWIMHHRAGVGLKTRAPNGAESRVLIRDTWNTEVITELKPESGDVQIYKNRYGGFYNTDLDARLKQMEVRYLVVMGCTTSVCVESTVREAMFLDYSAVVLEDCVGEPLGNEMARSNHEASLYVIAERNFGWVAESDAFLSALQSREKTT